MKNFSLSIKHAILDLVLFGVICLTAAALQYVRHARSERIWRELEEGTIEVEEYRLSAEGSFKMHVRPLGLMGYIIFDSELYVLQSDGRRLRYACRDNYWGWKSVRRRLNRIINGETGEKYDTFEEMFAHSYFIRSFSGGRSSLWLSFLDFLVSAFLVSIVGTVVHAKAKHGGKWRCSVLWKYCLTGFGALVSLYLFFLFEMSGAFG